MNVDEKPIDPILENGPGLDSLPGLVDRQGLCGTMLIYAGVISACSEDLNPEHPLLPDGSPAIRFI